MNDPGAQAKPQQWARQASGAVLWGLFLILAPLEVLLSVAHDPSNVPGVQ